MLVSGSTTTFASTTTSTAAARMSRWCHLLALLAVALLAAPDAVLGAALSDAEPSPADWPWPKPGEAEPPTTTLPPGEAEDAAANTTEHCQREQSRCEAELALQAGRVGPGPVPGGRPGRPVCGSNNATYDNECHLKRVQCEGRPVQMAHRGKCKDHTPCLSYRRRASRAGYVSSVFLPQCQPDGSYSPLQCHEESGFCWCVTPQGRQVPKSAVRGYKPDCSRPAKTRRGSGPRGASPRGWRRQRRGCGRGERANFKSNLIKIFRTEYRRAALASETRPGPGPGPGPDMDLQVLDWKFAELDKDGDGMLRRPEYQELRRVVRRVVTPKPCARTFARRCDMDGNKIISLVEWEACLGNEFNHRVRPAKPPARGAAGSGHTDAGMRPASPQGQTPGKARVEPAEHRVLQESVSTRAVQLPGFLLDNLERREEPEVTDCLTDRQAVLEEQRGASSALYVPECTEDGRYNKLQCYNSTGYCWCVHQDTGKPIPGTSAKDKRPACDTLAPTMKGCPEVRRKEFLKNLKELFKQRWQAAMNETDSSSTASRQVSPEDRIATWNFLAFDKNKNKVLDRAEWKAFRQLMSEHQQLRRCGKKLPRYCDANQDRSITISEWLDCLRTPPTVEAVTATSHNRKGPNPIESYLKDD